MSNLPTELTFDEFTKLVHDALNHLYDSPHLQTHPLVTLMVETKAASSGLPASQELRRILLQAIRAMRPQPGTPAQSADWRSYRILELRFIEGRSVAFVMEELALSRSQFFRDQARIVEAVAANLWPRRLPARPAALDAPMPSRKELARHEAQRLSQEAHWEDLDGALLIEGLRTIVESLAAAKQVTVRLHMAHPLRLLHVDRVMLRQSILNVITYAMDLIPGGTLDIHSIQDGRGSGVRVVAADARAMEHRPGQRQGTGLGIAVDLMKAMGGTLEVQTTGEGCWSAELIWPAQLSPLLLIVDDNEEFANLCRRYLGSQSWQVTSAASAEQARQSIEMSRPDAILLDVMMPQEDGWDLLIWLKANPATRQIPVAVCSVLNEPDLAATLGAEAFLTKPLSQQALLKLLLEWHPQRASQEPAR